MQNKTVRMLVESALFIAIATVLSMLKIDLPFGGGVTIVSMLPLVLVSHRWGWKWGVLTAFAYSLIQLLLGLDNVGYATTFATALGVIFLDYVIAYTVIGFSGALEKPFGKTLKAVLIGIAVVFVGRFLCHFITGVWIWGAWMPEEFMGLPMSSPYVYSLLYNGFYMVIDMVLCLVVFAILFRPMEKYLLAKDVQALQGETA